ncbi:hypothetical protein ACFE04_031296 [Oxalis oulophora]
MDYIIDNSLVDIHVDDTLGSPTPSISAHYSNIIGESSSTPSIHHDTPELPVVGRSIWSKQPPSYLQDYHCIIANSIHQPGSNIIPHLLPNTTHTLEKMSEKTRLMMNSHLIVNSKII